VSCVKTKGNALRGASGSLEKTMAALGGTKRPTSVRNLPRLDPVARPQQSTGLIDALLNHQTPLCPLNGVPG